MTSATVRAYHACGLGAAPFRRSSMVDDVDRGCPAGDPAACDVRQKALAVWPGLDRRKLTRTCGDPKRVARLVERRTALPRESILGILGAGVRRPTRTLARPAAPSRASVLRRVLCFSSRPKTVLTCLSARWG